MKNNEDLFLLEGQLKHKIDFIEKYVPKDVKVHLVGHSVGAWTIVQLLKLPEIKRLVHHSYLLFPTIERMKDSPAGKVFEERSRSFKGSLMLGFLGLLGWLPVYFRSAFVGHFIKKWNLPENYLQDAVKGLRTSAIERMLEMGWDQVNNVYNLDEDVIRANLKQMTFYYGTRDHWVPTQYYYELTQRFPEIDATLDPHNMAHAFNIRQGPQMADILSKWISYRRAIEDKPHQEMIKANGVQIKVA